MSVRRPAGHCKRQAFRRVKYLLTEELGRVYLSTVDHKKCVKGLCGY